MLAMKTWHKKKSDWAAAKAEEYRGYLHDTQKRWFRRAEMKADLEQAYRKQMGEWEARAARYRSEEAKAA